MQWLTRKVVHRRTMENAGLLGVFDTWYIDRMDRFLQLAALVRTVDRGSQAAAARELGVTAAMVGRYIQALEDRLGTRLLNRTTARQSLTEAGAAFYARAQGILEQMEEAETSAADRQAEPRGTLRVNAPMSFGTRHLAAAIAGFRRDNPRLRVELVLNDRVVDLVEEGYDVAVRIGRLAESGLIARRLSSCRLVVCASPGYLGRCGWPASPADLPGHDCLVYSYSSDGDIWRFHGEHGEREVRVSGSLVANNGDALMAAALADQGIVLQPSFIVGEALRDGRLLPVLPGWRLADFNIYAVYPSARHLSPKVRRFVDYLAARFRDPPPWEGDGIEQFDAAG